jgi:hypothetical protein
MALYPRRSLPEQDRTDMHLDGTTPVAPVRVSE